MKFNIISDLHCLPSREENEFGFHTEWFDFEPERLAPADYLIVAGDMGLFENRIDVIRELKIRTKGKFKDVLWILGNHDYWVDEKIDWFSHLESDLTFPCRNRKLEILDKDVAIIGTTLWTNTFNSSELKLMNDYRYIPNFNSKIKVERFNEESNWLRERYLYYKNLGKKVVVVTHHNPRSMYQIPEYSESHHDVYTAYWVSNGILDDIKPELWICGHIHEEFDGMINGVRFVRHPIGYRWGWYKPNPKLFPEDSKIIDSWYCKTVEV